MLFSNDSRPQLASFRPMLCPRRSLWLRDRTLAKTGRTTMRRGSEKLLSRSRRVARLTLFFAKYPIRPQFLLSTISSTA